MDKYIIVALYGKSGAGKDSIQKLLTQRHPGLHPIISMTTRPIREGEKDGVDYHFTDIVEFTKKVLSGDMLEATCFRDWFYGTPIESLDINKVNIGVFNIAGIEALKQDPRVAVYPAFVDAPDKVRLLRSLNREENPDCAEICRRFATDEHDFANIDFKPHYVIPNQKSTNLAETVDNLFDLLMQEFSASGQIWENLSK